jgi:hypothetical protein
MRWSSAPVTLGITRSPKGDMATVGLGQVVAKKSRS